MCPAEIEGCIRVMLLWGVPKEFVFLVILVSFLQVDSQNTYDIIELFAGKARIAKVGSRAGYKTASCDISYDVGESMDVNSACGLVPLAWSHHLFHLAVPYY
jgi:hypothetical protein